MDLGELMSRRQSQNIEDLRGPDPVMNPEFGALYENNMANTITPWQATTKYEPLPGQLGALAQSAGNYGAAQAAEFAALLAGMGIESRVTPDGGLEIRRKPTDPPRPTPNPRRLSIDRMLPPKDIREDY